MTRAEVKSKFDEIVDFSEVGKFLDTPVKHYSSGMYMRLAFSIAAHLEPEILVVDEVLAVGDAEFQKKCLGKMSDVSKQGRTILFVSHNINAIGQLCGRCVLLSRGHVKQVGPTASVVEAYVSESQAGYEFVRAPQGGGRPTLVAGRIVSSDGNDNPAVAVQIEIKGNAVRQLSVDIRLKDSSTNPVGFASFGSLAAAQMMVLGTSSTRIQFRLCTSQLAVGSYSFSFDLTQPEVAFYDRAEEVLKFDVLRSPAEGKTRALPQSWGYGSYELPIDLLQIDRGAQSTWGRLGVPVWVNLLR